MARHLQDKYELVVGLEVHAQLLTQSKLFCGDSASFGTAPNTHISPITLAHPGTLPKMNKKAIEYAIKMGLACNCEIEKHNYFARKNYFYPDLPKGYQISQHTTPICKGGFVKIKQNGANRNILLNRIHLEEDAGKSLHDQDDHYTCVDYNRAGVPLIEIVTEPDIRTADEAYAFLTELRKMLRYLEVCDGNMEEGSMRCDANISVRLKGETKLGTKVEVKNLNSIRHVKRAIEIEAKRLMEMIEAGESIQQQTRSFDADKNITFALRTKEEANDYRYFPDPDLTPFDLNNDFIDGIRRTIPPLAEELQQKYILQYGLSEYDAQQVTDEKDLADYFEEILQHTSNAKAAANWLNGPVRSYLNEKGISIRGIGLTPVTLAKLIGIIDQGLIGFSAAASRLFPALLLNLLAEPLNLAKEMNLLQDSSEDNLLPLVEAVLAKYPEKVNEYRKGKKGLMGLFVGEVMKMSKGKADPKLTNQLLEEKLAD
jgi:aspartyl-tRNA(Asn)/glutamyl-tRNA(Gln) amidotransferase subunit B